MGARMRWGALPVLGVCGAALLAGGCCSSGPLPGGAEDDAAVLPVKVGGIVAVQAAHPLAAPFEKAASRLASWTDLNAAQKGSLCVRNLDPEQDLAPQLAPALKSAALNGDETAAALKDWIKGPRDHFREARTMLPEVEKHAPPGVGAVSADPGGSYGVVVFKSRSDALLALADIRRGARATDAWLLEIDFHVSSSYIAGVNVYHLKAGATPVLTVQIYSWIGQVEGAFGAIARSVAEGEMRAQAEATWREVAAYLRK
jgi:hypothetical protein